MFRHHRSAWVTVVTTSASVHALVMQLYNAEVWWLGKKEIHHLAIHTCAVSHGTGLQRNRQTRQNSRACRPLDVRWWEVACSFSKAPRDVCQALWPSCPSKRSIQMPSIREVTQKKTLWYPVWASRVSELKTHLYKLDMNCISNHLTMWFGSELQKSDFICFLAVPT